MGYKQADTKLTDGKKANDAWSIGQGGFRFDWDASEKDQVTLQSDFYDGFPNPDGATAVVVMGGNMLGRWTRTLSDKSDFSIQTYYDQTFRDLRNGFKEKLKTFDVDWQYRFAAGKRNELIWGGDLRLMKDEMQNLELFAFEPANKDLHIYSIFLQDKLTLVPSRVLLTAGLKLEHNSYTGMEYSPSMHLSWAATSRHTLWAAISRAVRTPSRIDEDFTISLAPGVPLIQSSDFRTETLIAYELGWRSQPLESLSLSVGTFYNDYDHIRSVEPGPLPTGFPLTFKNDVEGHSHGIELSATYQPVDWWRLRGGYTFMKKKLKVKPGKIDLNNATAESDDPENQVLIQSMFDAGKRIQAGFVFRYISKLPVADVPAYAGLDAQISCKVIRNLVISVIGQNLLDDRHPEFVPSSPSPREIQRGINARVTCRF
jgi:iron complex outermembrane receptor protein